MQERQGVEENEASTQGVHPSFAVALQASFHPHAPVTPFPLTNPGAYAALPAGPDHPGPHPGLSQEGPCGAQVPGTGEGLTRAQLCGPRRTPM